MRPTVVALFGATQDIAVDAYRIEIAPIDAQGALVATYALGYRIGLLVAGAVALILADHVSWRLVYAAMAVAMMVPVATTLMAREPDVLRTRPERWRDAIGSAVVARSREQVARAVGDALRVPDPLQ